jgi:hypothetical protein
MLLLLAFWNSMPETTVAVPAADSVPSQGLVRLLVESLPALRMVGLTAG